VNKKVYIILINYNGWQDTIECLESVLKNDYENYQIIVVDNASPNNSMEYIQNWADGKQEVIYEEDSQLKYLSRPNEQKPLEYIYYSKRGENLEKKKDTLQNTAHPIIFIQSDENGGFAAGNNIGIKYALTQDDCEYVWLLNNDTVIERDALSKIVEYAKKNDIGICGSTLMYFHEPSKIQAYGGTVNKFFGTGRYILNKNDVNKKLDYIVGASFLINWKVLNKIGLLPEEYFLYYEETDYCFNAKRNSFKLGIALDSIVYHKEGSTTGVSINPMERSEMSDVLTLKNRIKFHRKYLGGGVGLWFGLLIAFFNRVKRGQSDRIRKVLF